MQLSNKIQQQHQNTYHQNNALLIIWNLHAWRLGNFKQVVLILASGHIALDRVNKSNSYLNNLSLIALTTESLLQICHEILALAEIIYFVYKLKQLWLLKTLALILFIYVANITFSGWWKHLIRCFWYTSNYRGAALVTMFCIPVASCGLYACLRAISKAHK